MSAPDTDHEGDAGQGHDAHAGHHERGPESRAPGAISDQRSAVNQTTHEQRAPSHEHHSHEPRATSHERA